MKDNALPDLTGSAERFRGKTAVVTGASSGIGRAVAEALAREGADLVLVGRRTTRLEAVTASLAPNGVQVEVVRGDVRESAVCDAVAAAAERRFGRLDALVNAAGVIGNGPVDATEPAEWDRVLDSNLRSVWLMMRAAGPALRRSRGSIVNLSSVAATRPYAGLAAYCVSKAAVSMLTRCAALDFAADGVRVNAVEPGVVVTELHTVGGAVADYPAFLERSRSTHPLGRVGQPAEIAAAVLYLLGPGAGWITGACLPIDGGRALLSAR